MRRAPASALGLALLLFSGVALAQEPAAAPPSAAAPAAPAGGEGKLRGARLVYVGGELSLLYGKSTPLRSNWLIGLDPQIELHLTPRWSVQAHGMYAFGLANDEPKSWWDIGARGIWRPPFLPAQYFGAGLGLGQAHERRSGRSQFESVTPHIDALVGVWEFDFDPIRFGPAVHFGFNFDGSYFAGFGIAGQFGFGPIRTTTR